MGWYRTYGLAIAFLFCAAPLAAQRSGIWIGLGLGTGMSDVGCDICRGENNGGWSARAAIGGRTSRRLKAGLELHGWTDRSDDIHFTFYSVTPALYWYPGRRSSTYFLMAGAGFVGYRAEDPDNADEIITSSAVGATFGAGLDMPLSGRFALTPFVTYTSSFLAHLKYDRTDIGRAQLSLFQLGFALTRR